MPKLSRHRGACITLLSLEQSAIDTDARVAVTVLLTFIIHVQIIEQIDVQRRDQFGDSVRRK